MKFMDNNHHQTIIDLFEEHSEELDDFGLEPKVKPIEHEGYDGFIPFTNGGLSLMVLEDLAGMQGSGTTYAEPAQSVLNDAIDYSLECGIDSFISDNLAKLKEIYGTDDTDALKEEVSYHSLYEKDQSTLAEELSNTEHESLSEGGEFWLVLRASYFDKDNARNESGADEIYFHAGVNTDFTYGRDSGLQITFEQTVQVADLDSGKVDLDDLVQQMANSITE